MTENRFWELIEDARQENNLFPALLKSLRGLSPDQIVGFQNMLRQKLNDSYSFPLLMANFVIQSYVSDDIFEDFRGFLVSQGRERFEAALEDPESICDWLRRDDVDDIDGEAMLLIALKAYESHSHEDEFYDRLTFPSEPTIEEAWPDDKAAFRQMYPRLVDTFWNQQRIDELHSAD